MPISSNDEGEMNLLININSETYSSFVEEKIIVGTPVRGFAIFSKGRISDNLFSAILLVVFLVFMVFIISRIIHNKRKRDIHRKALFHVIEHK